MPRPLSGTYFNEEADPREAVLERITPQALLEKTKDSVLLSRQENLPRDNSGKPQGHAGILTPLLEMVTTGQLRKGDETGSVSVSPYGFQITNIPQQDQDAESRTPLVVDQSKIWSLDVGPESVAYSKGDFGIGGTYGVDKSGFIRKGPLRIDAGYGVVNPYAPPDRIAPALSYTPKEPVIGPKEGWIKLGVELGKPKEMRAVAMPEVQAQSAVEHAVRPFETGDTSSPAIKTAREEADEFLRDYREKNEAWWRP